MTRLGIVLGVTLLVCGVALGVWQRVEPDGADDLRRWVVEGPEQPEPVIYKTTIFLDPNGTSTCNGRAVDVAWAKTALASQQFETGGTLRVYCPEAPTGAWSRHSLNDLWISIGDISIVATVQDNEVIGGVTNYKWSGYITDGSMDDVLFSIYAPADDDWHEFDWYIRHTAAVYSRTGANPIGAPEKSNQTHAKEGWAEDQWQVSPGSTVYVGFGGTTGDWEVTPGDPASTALGVTAVVKFSDFNPTPGLSIAQLTVEYNQAQPDFSGLGVVELVATPSTENNPLLEGSGNTLHWYVDGWPGGGREASSSQSMMPPRFYAFAGLAVVDMDDNPYPNVEVWCPAVQVYDETEEAWLPQKKTIAQWNAFTATPTWGIYSWDADPPPDGAVRVLADVYFYIDRDSAIDILRDGVGEEGQEASVTFGHDLRIVIDGWPLSAEDRESSPYVTGIASIVHRTNASLYGPAPALAHDDWVGGGGATSPDVAGDFTVSSAGGSLSLALPSGYEDRLSRVASLTAPLGIPELATVHQADYFYPADGDPEAVYCGRGWPCLRFDFPVLPGPAELTATLTVMTFSHSYLHETGEARQTEYEYSSSTKTYTYPLSVAANGVGYIYLAAPEGEGGDEPDLEVVTNISISGFGEGSWRVGTPYWSLDPNEAITQHYAIKFFENWRYADGGLSAQVDSVMHYALMDTTETNSGHDNPVETNTLRIFEYVQSPNYEIDLSAASSLEGYMGTVTACSDAWTGTYSEAAAEAATVDEDEAVLKGLIACDLKPVVGHNGGAMDAAVRVGVWTTVPGLAYDFTARKLIRGAIHGTGTDGTTLLRAEEVAPVWWRPADLSAGWVQHDAPVTDMAAHWRSDCGPVYHTHDPASILRDYGLGWNTEEDPIVSTGRWAAREYDYQTTIAQSVPGVPWLHFQRGGILHVVWAADSDGVVRYGYVEPWSATPELLTPGDDPFGGTGGYANPCIASHSCGLLVVAATRNGSMEVAQSRDLGATWTPVAGSTLVGDLANGTLAIQDGYLAACGHDGTSIVYRSSSGEGRYVADPLYSGGATEATVCAAAMLSNNQPPRSQVLWHHGALYALVETEGGASLYASDDGGVTWSEVAGTHIATTLRAGNLAWQDGELLACGYTSGGVVRVQSAYDPTRAPEAFYVGGPTSLQVTDGELGSAIECAHGERWVAVVPEELALYRMRAPAEGFEEV